jgi:superfamily II DNA helicase RecQ
LTLQIRYVDKDFTREAKEIVDSVYRMVKDRKRFAYLHVLDVYLGSKKQKIVANGHEKLPFHGKGKAIGRADAERVLRKMICEDFLREELYTSACDFTATSLSVGEKAKDLSEGRARFSVPFAEDKTPRTGQQVAEVVPKSDVDENCYQDLLDMLIRIAREQNIQNYANVLPLPALREIATKLPETRDEFLQITHVSDIWYRKYANRFLDTIKSYKQIRLLNEQCDGMFDDAMIDDFTDEEDDEESFAPSTSSGARNSRGKSKGTSNRAKYNGKRGQSSSASTSRFKKSKTKW